MVTVDSATPSTRLRIHLYCTGHRSGGIRAAHPASPVVRPPLRSFCALGAAQSSVARGAAQSSAARGAAQSSVSCSVEGCARCPVFAGVRKIGPDGSGASCSDQGCNFGGPRFRIVCRARSRAGLAESGQRAAVEIW